MKLQKSLVGLMAIAGLLLGARIALAEDAPPPLPGDPEFCQENPGKCEEARAKHEAFCKENPERCERMKQRRAKREAFCKENPKKCEEQREKMKQRRAEMKAKCAEDPAKCEQMKQEQRERFKQRQGGGAPPAGKEAAKPPSE